MSNTIGDKYFNLTMKVVNYAFEFVNQPGYAFLRFTDLLNSLLSLTPEIQGVNREEFYQSLREKLQGRRNLATPEEKTALLNEIISSYVEEWRKAV